MSKVQMGMAERMARLGVPEEGCTVAVEHGVPQIKVPKRKRQVYLRWVGTRDGEPFVGVSMGPWDAEDLASGTLVLAEEDAADLRGSRKGLEEFSRVAVSGLEVAEVTGGELGGWHHVGLVGTFGDPCESPATAHPPQAVASGFLDAVPKWWTEEDTRMAMASNDGHLHECHGQCEGDFRDCPFPGPNCAAVCLCRWCMSWESEDGVRGVCQDPAYDGERKRATKAGKCFCGQFNSRWIRDDQTAEAERIIAESDKRYRVSCVRHGDIGEETHYLSARDDDGNILIGFGPDAAKASRWPMAKASVLVDVIRSVTRDDSVRIEEVAHV